MAVHTRFHSYLAVTYSASFHVCREVDDQYSCLRTPTPCGGSDQAGFRLGAGQLAFLFSCSQRWTVTLEKSCPLPEPWYFPLKIRILDQMILKGLPRYCPYHRIP